MTRLAAALTLVLALVPVLVAAQTVPAPRLDHHLQTLDDGPFSLGAQPAALGFREGVHTGVSAESGATSPRIGAGWYNSAGNGRGLGIGVGGEWAADPERTGAFLFGLSLGGPHAALGWTRRAMTRGAFDGASFHDVGFLVRPNNVFAFGGVVSNVAAPRVSHLLTRRSFDVGIGLRTVTGRVQGDLGLRVVEQIAANEVRVGARVRIVRGLNVFGLVRLGVSDGIELARAGGGIEFAGGPMRQSVGATTAAPGPRDAALAWVAAEMGTPFPVQGRGARDTLLRIDLAGDLPESPPFRLFGTSGPTVTDLLATLDRVAREGEMGGVYVWLGGLTAGGAQLWELREALQRVRDEGGVVVAYLENATVRDLYIASVADYVIAAPSVAVLDAGLSTSRTYLAELLDRLGIEAQFVRIAEYKSSPERFTRSAPSPESDEQLDAFLDDVWPFFRDAIGERLGSTADEVDAWLVSAPLMADDLVEAGFADVVAYRDQVADELSEHFGHRMPVTYRYGRIDMQDESWFPRAKVAVIHVSGAIVSGGGGYGILSRRLTTGSATIEDAARAIRNDHSIDAVVVRIDSPGGSASASDDMQRALSRLVGDRPVFVSMADIAASGGYYVSALDAPVHATPITMTGSIGIYAGTFAIDGLLDMLGINRVRNDRGGPADFFDGSRWDDDRVDAMQRLIDGSYDIFLDRVAEARDTTPEAIDEVGRGRIWSGVDALDVDLVDSLSGFPGVLHAIRVELDLSERAPITLVHYPEQGGFGVPSLALALGRALGVERGPDLADLLEGAGMAAPIELMELALGAARGEAMAHLGFALTAW